jgi:pimeloyl-ACP methyl ester carboxylesterase
MKISLQRITTEDGLELQGLLYEPDKKTNKAIAHVHGWIGNFYENKFIDFIAREVVSKGFAFLTFNNRGAGVISDFIKRQKSKIEYVKIGGSLEEFKDCTLDIKTAVNFLSNKGYEKIVLDGHSLGCQKVTYYKHKTRDQRVSGLILLAPVDDVAFSKNTLKAKYNESINIARKMVESGKGDDAVQKWMAFYDFLSANMFLNVADPESDSGRLFDFSGDLKEIKDVACPVLAIFGSEDEYQSDPEDKLKLLSREVKNCNIKLIRGAGHGFINFEKQLSEIIGNWIKSL